jgi:hypothetical protein
MRGRGRAETVRARKVIWDREFGSEAAPEWHLLLFGVIQIWENTYIMKFVCTTKTSTKFSCLLLAVLAQPMAPQSNLLKPHKALGFKYLPQTTGCMYSEHLLVQVSNYIFSRDKPWPTPPWHLNSKYFLSNTRLKSAQALSWAAI